MGKASYHFACLKDQIDSDLALNLATDWLDKTNDPAAIRVYGGAFNLTPADAAKFSVTSDVKAWQEVVWQVPDLPAQTELPPGKRSTTRTPRRSVASS